MSDYLDNKSLPDPALGLTDELFATVGYYRDLLQAVSHIISSQQHAIIYTGNADLSRQLLDNLQRRIPAVRVIDGALLTKRRYLKSFLPDNVTPYSVVIHQADKVTASCLNALLEARRRFPSPFASLVLIFNTPARQSGRIPDTMDFHRLQLRQLTREECRHYLVQLFQHPCYAGINLSDNARERLIGAARCQPDAIRRLAMVACQLARGEQREQLLPHHVRAAAREQYGHITPHWQALILFALIALAAASIGWKIAPSLPAGWHHGLLAPAQTASTPVAKLEDVTASPAQGLQQLYGIWGYKVRLDDAFCESAFRGGLKCKSGDASLDERVSEGYPWVAELQVNNKKIYAPVVRVDKQQVEILVDSQTWLLPRAWFIQHATPRYTLLYRLTPSGASKVDSASPPGDLAWLNSRLSRVLITEPLKETRWNEALVNRIRQFQLRAELETDGYMGEMSVMALSRLAGESPQLLAQ